MNVKRRFLSTSVLLALSGLAIGSAPATAAEGPISLSAEQMDAITAGSSVSSIHVVDMINNGINRAHTVVVADDMIRSTSTENVRVVSVKNYSNITAEGIITGLTDVTNTAARESLRLNPGESVQLRPGESMHLAPGSSILVIPAEPMRSLAVGAIPLQSISLPVSWKSVWQLMDRLKSRF
jgi:hypothetical protein